MSDTLTNNLKLSYPAVVGQQGWNEELQNDLQLLDGYTALGGCAVTTAEVPSTTLHVDVAAGTWLNSSGQPQTYAGSTSNALTASATNYVYLTDSGTLTINTTGFPTVANCVPLATVVTGTSNVTTLTDSRNYLISQRGIRSTVQNALAVNFTEYPSTTLHVSVAAGSFINAAGSFKTYAGTSSLTLSASTTTYLWLTDAGVLTTGAAFPTATSIVPLASVVTAGSTVTSITDQRVIYSSRQF